MRAVKPDDQHWIKKIFLFDYYESTACEKHFSMEYRWISAISSKIWTIAHRSGWAGYDVLYLHMMIFHMYTQKKTWNRLLYDEIVLVTLNNMLYTIIWQMLALFSLVKKSIFQSECYFPVIVQFTACSACYYKPLHTLLHCHTTIILLFTNWLIYHKVS